MWPGGGRSVRAGLSNREYITEYRESLFADLGLWSFKFMRTLSLSSLSQRLCHMFFVCVIFVVMRLLFFFSSQSSLVLVAVDSEQARCARAPRHRSDIFKLLRGLW